MIVLAGRTHLYEGHGPGAVAHGVRTLAALGAGTVVLTNANGSLRPQWPLGRVVVLTDHLNLTGLSPLAGARFVDLTAAYDPELRAALLAAAADDGVELATGVYAMLAGPHYETAAEAGMVRALGADVLGMSTVLETIAAREAGLRVLALSTVTAHEASGRADRPRRGRRRRGGRRRAALAGRAAHPHQPAHPLPPPRPGHLRRREQGDDVVTDRTLSQEGPSLGLHHRGDGHRGDRRRGPQGPPCLPLLALVRREHLGVRHQLRLVDPRLRDLLRPGDPRRRRRHGAVVPARRGHRARRQAGLGPDADPVPGGVRGARQRPARGGLLPAARGLGDRARRPRHARHRHRHPAARLVRRQHRAGRRLPRGHRDRRRRGDPRLRHDHAGPDRPDDRPGRGHPRLHRPDRRPDRPRRPGPAARRVVGGGARRAHAGHDGAGPGLGQRRGRLLALPAARGLLRRRRLLDDVRRLPGARRPHRLRRPAGRLQPGPLRRASRATRSARSPRCCPPGTSSRSSSSPSAGWSPARCWTSTPRA